MGGRDKATNWRSRVGGVPFPGADLCSSPRIQRNRLGNAVFPQPPSATFMHEFSNACELTIACIRKKCFSLWASGGARNEAVWHTL